MLDEAIDYLSKDDALVAIQYLNEHDDPLVIAQTYNELVQHLYWQLRDLPGLIIVAYAGMQYGLMMAERASDKVVAAKIKGVVKAISYNLASFTWPGWNEPELRIDPVVQKIGRDAARTNLRLAFELKRGDDALARAYWMLGAQELAAGRLDEARKEFSRAAKYAASAHEDDESLLAEGFEEVVNLVEDSDDDDARKKLTKIKEKLAGGQHGTTYIDQLDTALRVFGGAPVAE